MMATTVVNKFDSLTQTF